MWARVETKEGEDGHLYSSGMGIRFVNISKEARQTIEEHIARF